MQCRARTQTKGGVTQRLGELYDTIAEETVAVATRSAAVPVGVAQIAPFGQQRVRNTTLL
jgi:hypothetical protein